MLVLAIDLKNEKIQQVIKGTGNRNGMTRQQYRNNKHFMKDTKINFKKELLARKAK